MSSGEWFLFIAASALFAGGLTGLWWTLRMAAR
jgi:hypothetical protein